MNGSRAGDGSTVSQNFGKCVHFIFPCQTDIMRTRLKYISSDTKSESSGNHASHSSGNGYKAISYKAISVSN